MQVQITHLSIATYIYLILLSFRKGAVRQCLILYLKSISGTNGSMTWMKSKNLSLQVTSLSLDFCYVKHTHI